MKRISPIFFILVMLQLGIAWDLRAQSYSIDWFTIDGGGGTSAGGGFTLSGTIGQPDAGRLSGGAYTLEGGFWPAFSVVSVSGAPTLFITLLGAQVQISWSPATPGFALEESTVLPGTTWSVSPPGNPVTIPVTGQSKFYRLKAP